ncbi:MAG TPA: ubiquinone/menaquinone biosynthesis methyltransferase [Candidatus Saccharimonadales bacterium]|nr:ubiquinone/menaquinone biosynthesis methyltransferase [Candidatus Saccharimonadales bacterium]
MDPTEQDHDRSIAAMFDRISPRYDFFNRVLSFGTDIGWRRRALEELAARPGERVLDLGSGTGDLAFAVAAAGARVVAADLSHGMLAVLLRRSGRERAGRLVGPVVANVHALPLRDGSVDRVVSGFTVRNVGDLPSAFRELRRVLRPGGRLVVLELSHPPRRLFALTYRAYFEQVAPRLAAALGGDPDAYRYLPRSLRAFPGADELATVIRSVGFVQVRYERLFFGIAALHIAERTPSVPLKS